MRCPFHHRAPRLSTPSPTTRRPNTRSLNYKIRPSSYGSGCTLHDNTAPMSPMDTFVLSACPLSSPSARNRMSMPSCAPPLSLAPHPSFPFFPFACLNSCVCVWKFYASASESAACSSSHDFFASPSRMSVFSCGRIRVQGKRVSGGRMRCVSAQLLYLHYRRPDCRCPRTRPSP